VSKLDMLEKFLRQINFVGRPVENNRPNKFKLKMLSLSTRGFLLKDIDKMIEMLVLQLYDPEYQKDLQKNLDELIELRIGIL
jgi:hypothetical protein